MTNFRISGAVGVIFAGLAASAAWAETFTLRIGSGHPNGPAIYVADVADVFVPEVKRRVAEETEHEVEFVEGYGGAIAGVAETLEAVQNGILDIGAYCFCFEPAKLFTHNFPYFAPFGPQNAAQAMTAVRAVYDETPWLTRVFEEEYGQKLLGLHGWDNYHLGSTMQWDSVEDLDGVKIGGAGPNLPWLEFVGAVPVQSTLPDGYMSLQTGVYEGWLMFPSSYLGFKFYEPAPNYTLIGFGAMQVNGLTMNLDSFNMLPEEIQRILVEAGRAYEDAAGESLNAAQERGLKGLEEVGANIREISPEVRSEWAESLAAFPGQQVAEAESRGMPGAEVLKAYFDAVAETGYEWPHDYSVE